MWFHGGATETILFEWWQIESCWGKYSGIFGFNLCYRSVLLLHCDLFVGRLVRGHQMVASIFAQCSVGKRASGNYLVTLAWKLFTLLFLVQNLLSPISTVKPTKCYWTRRTLNKLRTPELSVQKKSTSRRLLAKTTALSNGTYWIHWKIKILVLVE